MATERPIKGHLYTWNCGDGFLGLPRRKIRLKGIKSTLLHVAYLGGGERWDGHTPAGAVLCLILEASGRRNQPSHDYYFCFEHYDMDALRRTSGGKVEELSSGGTAWWSVELPCRGWSTEQTDSTIERILQWHQQEMRRVNQLCLADRTRESE